LLEFEEKPIEDVDFDAKTSTTSLLFSRFPSNCESVKGKSEDLPFQPASVGLEIEREKLTDDVDNDAHLSLSAGDKFPQDNLSCLFSSLALNNSVSKDIFLYSKSIEAELLNDLKLSSECDNLWNLSEPAEVSPCLKSRESSNFATKQESDEKSLQEFLNVAKSAVVEISIKSEKSPSVLNNTEFAEVLDVNQVLPPFNELVSSPAFTYPFELDTFQKQAILCIEDKKNIFVAAHTSAGKTVVAEYAIALSIRRNLSRVVYTSPIKALSNQKFRDFATTFGQEEVGIITGDIQIRTNANCLIMTTEILLHMLYHGSDVIRDIEWVIFDEVHYMNDLERGHVWEEVFIMLPKHINLVLLSATVQNVMEFADWLGRTRKQKTYVVYTTKRPVPLEHYLYTGCDKKSIDEKFLFIDVNGHLLQQGYQQALNAKKERESKFQKSFGAKNKLNVKPRSEKNIYITVIRHLQKEQKLPVIVFTFSRKRCDSNVQSLCGSLDLTTNEEKRKIHMFIAKSLLKLKKVDRELPQVKLAAVMLKNGFGVHHSGILPLLKEITEILFQNGLVRVLFATETFAMGVNMPARTVLFDSVYKHDGVNFRELQPSEYIQMAGRAGRRGKDKTGYVLVLCKGDIPELSTLYQMSIGKATPLESQFRLTYSMILNILRAREHIRIESIMEKSFLEHHPQKMISDRRTQLKSIQLQLKQIQLDECDVCKSDLNLMCNHYLNYKYSLKQVMPMVCKQMNSKKVNFPGRLVIFEHQDHPFMIGVIITSLVKLQNIIIELISVNFNELIESQGNFSNLKVTLEKVKPENIHLILKDTIEGAYLKISREKNSDPFENRVATFECVSNLLQYLIQKGHERPLSNFSGLFFLDTIKFVSDLGLNKLEDSLLFDKLNGQRNELLSYECLDCPKFKFHFDQMMAKVKLERQKEDIYYYLSKESLQFFPDYESRIKVLKMLNFINSEGCLELKGKIGCLMTDHELVITELLTENVLGDLSPPEIASLLSSFVFQESSSLPQNLSEVLAKVNQFFINPLIH